MDLTTNYSLGKPLPGENYDIVVPNANMDSIDATLKDAFDQIDARVSKAWVAIPLDATYEPYNGTLTPQYRIEADGVIRLRGWLKKKDGSTIAPNEIFISALPVAIRPTLTTVLTCAHGTIGSSARGNVVRAEITAPGGAVRLIPSTAYDPIPWVSLDGNTYVK